jgi:hypothetical protein
MTIFIAVYHIGMVIINEIDSYEFVGMKKETFLLNEFPTPANVVRLLRERLGWMDEGYEVRFEGHIDIGSSNEPLTLDPHHILYVLRYHIVINLFLEITSWRFWWC